MNNGYFGHNLWQFDDCLFGAFGFEAQCVVIWKNSCISKSRLNTEMLVDYYENEKRYAEEDLIKEIEELKHASVNPDDYGPFYKDVIDYCTSIIEDARNNKITLFDRIVDLITSVKVRSHVSRNIEFVLE